MAEDVVQEAFTRLVINNNLDKIEDVNSRRTRNFLLKIVIRLAFTKYRQSNKINCVEFHEEFYRTQTESSLDPTWEQYELIDKKEFLNSQISKLPERDQELLIYRFVFGMPFKEIASLMDVSIGYATMRVSRIRQKLKKSFELREKLGD